MPKFEKGDWVRKKRSDKVGMVTGHAGRRTRVRWFGAKAKTETIGTVMLSESKPRAFVIEGYLDGSAHSVRSSEPVLRKWLDMAGIDLAYARVNILDDLPVIAKSILRKQPPFVHIICHGVAIVIKSLIFGSGRDLVRGLKLILWTKNRKLCFLHSKDSRFCFRHA